MTHRERHIHRTVAGFMYRVRRRIDIVPMASSFPAAIIFSHTHPPLHSSPVSMAALTATPIVVLVAATNQVTGKVLVARMKDGDKSHRLV